MPTKYYKDMQNGITIRHVLNFFLINPKKTSSKVKREILLKKNFIILSQSEVGTLKTGINESWRYISL